MKKFSAALAALIFFIASPAQDTPRIVEPGMETSGTNTELLYIALAGLGLLLLLYFVWRRRRR